jgi:hypothetical protein
LSEARRDQPGVESGNARGGGREPKPEKSPEHPNENSPERLTTQWGAVWALLALAAAHVGLIATTEFLPFVDLPFHLGVATILRDYADPANLFDQYYALRSGGESLPLAGQPNVLHLWFCSLPIFPSAELANKIYFSLYCTLLPLSLLVLIRELRGNQWFALLGFLYLFNFNTHWGFVGYIAGIPAVLFLVALVVRHFERPGPSTALALALGSAALFSIHVLSALFFLLAFGLACLIRPAPERRLAARSLALMLPLLGLIGWWWGTTERPEGDGLAGFLLDYYASSYLPNLMSRKWAFVLDNAFLATGKAGYRQAGILALASVALLVWSALFEGNALRVALASARVRSATALVAAAAICFYLLPQGLPGQWALYQRYSVFLALGLIALTSAIEMRRLPRTLSIALIVAACVLHWTLYADYFRDFDRENAGFAEEILPEAGDTPLAGMIFEPYFRNVPAYIHFTDYYITRNRGIAVTNIVDFRFGTLEHKPGGRPLPSPLKSYYTPPRYSPDQRYNGEFDELDWLVVRGPVPALIQGSLGHFREARRTGEWTLFERR